MTGFEVRYTALQMAAQTCGVPVNTAQLIESAKKIEAYLKEELRVVKEEDKK